MFAQNLWRNILSHIECFNFILQFLKDVLLVLMEIDYTNIDAGTSYHCKEGYIHKWVR